MSVTLSRWLSDQTAELHRLVEAQLLPGGRVAAFDDVVRLVTIHARVLSRYADPLDAVQHIPGAAPLSRWRLAAQADLAAWGAASADVGAVGSDTVGSEPVGSESVGSESVGSEPVGSEPVGSEPGPDELVGVRYVLEGARVGLRVLAPQVVDAVRTAGVAGSEFFVPEPDAGHRWHAVRDWLDGAENLPTDRQQVLLGAQEAFAAYRPEPTT
jgi:heme oxygenase